MTVSIVTSANGVTGASPSMTFPGYTPALNDTIAFLAATTTVVALNAIDSAWVNPLGGLTNVVSDTNGLSIIYHEVTSAEVAAVTTTYTAAGLYATGPPGYLHGVVLRGVDATTPIDAINTAQDPANTVTPHVVPGLPGASLLTGSLVLSCIAKDTGGSYSTPPTGWTFVQNTAVSQALATISLDTATIYNTSVPATSITPDTGDEYCSITVAFTLSGATAPAGNTSAFFAMF